MRSCGKMSNYTDVSIKNESSEENDNGLDESSKSNGFLYVDINDYNENNLDGIEIKEEEEHVEDLIFEKNRIDSNEIYFEENLPLNSLKNLANHSQNDTSLGEGCVKSCKKRRLSSKLIQKENISVKKKIENFKSSRYKLRTRTWSNKINYDLIENIIKKKEAKSSSEKKVINSTEGNLASLTKKNLCSQEARKKIFECLSCQKSFCNNSLLDKHLKLCRFKQSTKSLKFYSENNENCYNDKTNLRKVPENYKLTFFKCDKCKRTFKKKNNLVSHVLKNNCTLEICTCAICEETFLKKNSLKKHIIAHLDNQSLGKSQCCLQTFGSFTCLNNHSMTRKENNEITSQKNSFNCVNNINNFNCISTELSESDGFLEPIDNHSSKVSCSTIYKCQMCKKTYKGIIAYKRHLKRHRGNVKCECNNKSHDSSKLSNHMKADQYLHINAKTKKKLKYECDTYEKGFIKAIKPKIHLGIQQKVNYQCDKCSAKFPNQEDLDTHKNRKDCKSEDLCTCQTCGKVFAKRDYLKKHQYMHMNVLFKCKYCYCAFMKEKSYKRHMEKMNCSKSARKIRMSEFNYKKCRFCHIEYETEELLIEHFRTSHSGLEPHQCFCCDSCLPSFQELQNHIHQHNIQKYTCNLCGKPYTSQEGFRKHRLKHKGAEFKCKFCDSEFLNENRFKFHQKTCKKNPESGYEPSQEKEKLKKKSDKPKQSRQLHWESRIIMKRLRGDPKLFTGNQVNVGTGQSDNTVASVFFDEPETDITDDKGWFNNYYKTDEDDITFGLKKANKVTHQDSDSDLGASEFLQTDSVVTKKKAHSPPSSLTKVINTSSAEDREMDDMMDTYSETSSENSSSDSVEEVEETILPIDYNPKKCRLCVISFDQEYELIHHFIKTHPGEYAHKCPQCETQSPLYAQLKEHLKTHGIGIGIFNCDNCSKQFKSEKKMNSHSIRCKGVKNKTSTSDENSFFQSSEEGCKRCGKKFHSKCGYRRHRRLCKKQKNKRENSNRFNNSSAKLNSKEETVADNSAEGDDFLLSDLEEEELIKTSNDKTISESGDSANNENSNSTKLVEVSSNAAEVQKEEKNNDEVKSNYTREPPMDSFPCRLCDKKFQYERGIVMHFKSDHPGHKPLICHVCNMHLADKLKEHLKTHGIGEEFVCELCGKRFNQKFLSKIHEMWHQGIEYKCSNCKQKFLNKEKMDKHIGENRCSNRQSLMRLPCDICGKSYRSKFGLSKHYITHTPKELRPVKNRMNCEYCGKWFEYNNGLQRHRRIHTGERPFCCRFCPKAFAQEGNCKAHERIHTGESKPRKKKQSAVPMSSNVPQSAVLAPQLPSLSAPLSPHLPPPVSAVESIAYPGHINLYIYNNIDPSGTAH